MDAHHASPKLPCLLVVSHDQEIDMNIPEYSRHVENGELFEFFRDSMAICAGPISYGGPSEDDEGNWIGGGIASRERLPVAIRHWWDWLKEQQV